MMLMISVLIDVRQSIGSFVILRSSLIFSFLYIKILLLNNINKILTTLKY